MTELGADWSYAPITGAQCVAAGVKAAGRYLGTDGRCITAAEYQDLRAHGIGVWLIREGGASGMLNGHAQGVSDAQVAQAQINVIGLPSSSAVYATADFDVQPSQYAACDDYLRGFASVLGVGRTGIYGGLRYLNHVHAAGLAVRFWQAGATSWDHGEAPQMTLHLHQTTNTPPLPGTDHNYILDAAFAGGGATPINNLPAIALESEMKMVGVPKGTIALLTPTSGQKYSDPSSFEFIAAVAAYGPVQTTYTDDKGTHPFTEDQISNLVSVANARGAALAAAAAAKVPAPDLSGVLAAIGKITTVTPGPGPAPSPIDYAALAKAVNDDAARRLAQ